MSKEMTAEEYLNENKDDDGYGDFTLDVRFIDEYKRLVAKEAVKGFAEELMKHYKFDSSTICMHIRNIAKQKGVNL